MPVKAKPKVKKYPVNRTVIHKKVTKAKPVSEALETYKRIIESRYRIAMAVYEHQDDLTKEVLDRIRDRLRIASTGVVNINGKPHKLEQEYIDFNILFIACEILSDLALNDIQIANFNFHPVYCAECKREIAGVKEPKNFKAGRPKGQRK